MVGIIKIGAWNSNELQQRLYQLKTFIYSHDIDISLIFETHLTNKNYIKILYYCIYDAEHSSV